jgi:hypothetical protein
MISDKIRPHNPSVVGYASPRRAHPAFDPGWLDEIKDALGVVLQHGATTSARLRREHSVIVPSLQPFIPNRTNTDSSFRGAGEAREPGIQ